MVKYLRNRYLRTIAKGYVLRYLYKNRFIPSQQIPSKEDVLEMTYELMKEMKKDNIKIHIPPFPPSERDTMVKRTELIGRTHKLYIEIEGVDL